MAGKVPLVLAAFAVLGAAAGPDPKTETEHVVKSGETLGGVASRAEVPRVLIIEANALKAPYAVRQGQKLVIPRRKSRTVKEGETGFAIALDEGVPWSAIAAANGIDPKAPVKAGQKLVIPTMARPTSAATATATATAAAAPAAAPAPSPAPSAARAPATLPPDTAKAPDFDWPVRGKIRRAFAPHKGKAAFHDGVDILADKGDPVRAAAAGKVIFAGQGPSEYGLTVILHHGGRWTTTYSYLDKITVKDGAKVKDGERLGLIGQTGLASEPQLHFEVRRNRVALDPVKYLPDDSEL